MNSINPRSTATFFAALLSGCLAAAQAYAITPEELEKKVEELAAQNAALQAKVEKLEAFQKQQSSSGAVQQAAPVPQVQPPATLAAATAPPAPAASASSSTTIGSYGEIGYSRPSKAPQEANVSVGRAVILVGHEFDESTRMYGGFEWENAITSATDNG